MRRCRPQSLAAWVTHDGPGASEADDAVAVDGVVRGGATALVAITTRIF